MVCPKCGRPRVDAPECPACGVIYARFRPPPPAQATPPPVVEAPRPATRSWAVLATLAAAGLVAVAAGRVLSARKAGGEAAPSGAPEGAVPESAGPRSGAGEPPRPADAHRDAPAPALPSSPPPAPSVAPQARAGGDEVPAAEPAGCEIYGPDGIPEPPPPPRVSGEWHEGARGWERAVEEGTRAGAPVLALFYTDWCPHCRRFAAEVVPSPEMCALGERVVKARVNAEGSPEDQELARRLGVRSYPTVLLLAPGAAGPTRVAAHASPGAFVDACERALPDAARVHLDRAMALQRSGPPEQAVPELKAAASAARLAPFALDHLGTLALRAGCFRQAEAVYTRVLELAPGYAGGRAHYLRGLARLRTGATAPALADAEAACRFGHREGCEVVERARRAPGAPP
jgi:thiol-disulfide isomerase/thioredoxin